VLLVDVLILLVDGALELALTVEVMIVLGCSVAELVLSAELAGDVALEENMVVADVKMGPLEGVSSKLVDEAMSSELCTELNLGDEVWLALAGAVLGAVIVELAVDTVVDDTVPTVLEPELANVVVADMKVGPSEGGVPSKLVDKAVSSELCAEVIELVSDDDCVEELNDEV
jgi:hypothetical protein